MGRIRRGGYIFEWWIGDHPHVIFMFPTTTERSSVVFGSIRSNQDEWQPSRKVIEIIKELQREGRL